MSRGTDHYALLGVPREASALEIRERFRALAREVHPDRVPKEKKAEAEARFQELTEAVNVLTHAGRRKAYDFSLAMASRAGAAVTDDYLALGIVAYRQKKYAEAAGNFGLAIHQDPKDARAQHYLGLASARSGDLRTAIKAIETAMMMEPHNVALLKDAGAIFRQAGLLTRAEKAYQEVLVWDAGAADARKALEEIHERRGSKG